MIISATYYYKHKHIYLKYPTKGTGRYTQMNQSDVYFMMVSISFFLDTELQVKLDELNKVHQKNLFYFS